MYLIKVLINFLFQKTISVILFHLAIIFYKSAPQIAFYYGFIFTHYVKKNILGPFGKINYIHFKYRMKDTIQTRFSQIVIIV